MVHANSHKHMPSAARLRLTAAWLISSALVAIPAPSGAQSSSDLPYTLDGVRRAAAGRAVVAQLPDDQPPAPDGSAPAASGPRDGRPELYVSTQAATPAEAGNRDRVETTSLGGFFSGWQERFVTMTTPPYYAPFGYMRNGERAVGAASSLGIAVATNQVARLFHRILLFARSRKAAEARREVDAELSAHERANAGAPAQRPAAPGKQRPAAPGKQRSAPPGRGR